MRFPLLSQRIYLCILLIWVVSSIVAHAQTDPNTDANWDWRAGDNPSYTYPGTEYKIYIGSIGSYIYLKAPWSQFNVPDALDDNKKEDGWVLLARDFGTATRPAFTNSPGYFILYNKLKAVLRIFIIVQASQNFSTGAIVVNFEGATKTATLSHLGPRSYALDKSVTLQNSSGSAFTNTVANYDWVWGDFPMAYDNTIVPTASTTCPRITFQVIGTTETNIHLDGNATGIGGTYKNAKDFIAGSSNGNGLAAVAASMPTNQGTSFSFDGLKSSVFGTSESWAGWKNSINDLYKNLAKSTDTNNAVGKSDNRFAASIKDLADSWIVSNLPGIGAAAGLVDFLISGGKKTNTQQTGPTYFAFNLQLTGTAVTNYRLASGATVPIPTAKSNPEVPCLGSSVPLLNNNAVGLLNLTTTPVLRWKTYMNQLDYTHGREYAYFQVKDELQYTVNPASGLTLDSIRAWIVMDPSNQVILNDPTHDRDLLWLSGQTVAAVPTMQIESTIKGRYVYRTIPVDGNAFRYQRITGPMGTTTPDMTIKIKAIFHRQDDPTATPVVMIATYEPDFEYDQNGVFPTPPTPVIAPVINGWNMTSVPNSIRNYSTGLTSFATSLIYPTAVSPVYAYENGGWQPKTTLANGVGYFLKFGFDQQIKYYGTRIPYSSTDYKINVVDGWNLIGSVTTPVAIADITYENTSLASGATYFRFNGSSYVPETGSLQPGFGYWVKLSGNGKVVLNTVGSGGGGGTPTVDPPPGPPTLSSPGNTATGVSITPTLSWVAPSGPVNNYRLQVSTDAFFNNVPFDFSPITGTSKYIGTLAYSTAYYWRVSASNTSGNGVWSSIYSFTTQGQPAPDPCGQVSTFASMDMISVSDANGNNQPLYVRNQIKSLLLGIDEAGEMPPEPITGVFHARFGSGKFIESIPTNGMFKHIPIKLRSASFPITVKWNINPDNAINYWLTLPGQGNKKIRMNGQGSYSLSQSSGGNLLVTSQAVDPCQVATTARHAETLDNNGNPENYTLKQNLPNPFNPSTIINYELPVNGYVSLKVFNTIGQEVATLVDEFQNAGYKSIPFNASVLPSGMYFYRLQSGDFTQTKKMLLLK